MGNLTGANIRDWVQSQIQTRQTKLALENRDNDTIVWSNAKTSWLRMISSVNVSPEKSKELTGDENYSGRRLAQNYVLFGGVVNNENASPELKQGVANTISPDSNPLTNSVYGFNETRGLSPMPGLSSASIKAMNRGALKKAEIKFVAKNKEQFKILDALYMRVGYTILLEYGHTMYFDNDGVLQHASYNTKPFEIFRTGEYKEKEETEQGKQQAVLKEIDKHREITNGNYDGFFGKITNFNWSLNTDGSYDITISAISIGDVIESLNINRPLPSEKDNKSISENSSEGSLPLIIARKDKSNLDKWLYFRYNEVANLENTTKVPTSNITSEVKTKISYKTLKEVNGNTTLDINRATLAIFPKKGEVKAYMKLGTLLQYINENLLIVDGEGKNYFSIDYDFEENTCTTHPFQFSSNPNICIVPFYAPDRSNGKYKFTKKFQYFSEITLDKFRDTESDYVAKLMHIHVNMEYITSLIDKATNEKTGDLYLRGFLANLMDGIQGALGGINKFTVSYNSEENKLKIYDDVPLDPKATKTNQGPTAEFRVFGVEPGTQGSFVTNVSLNATISSEFATMISIGAQANSTSDITNATALSKLNQGLTDSITPIKRSVSPKPPQEEETPEYKLGETYSKLVENGGLIFEFYFRNGSVTDIIPQATSLNSQFNKFLTTFLSVKKNVPSTQGFIPFDLGLEMEGLSGPRIYEKFSISGDILPDSYPQTLAFLIKGLNHTIDQKGWSTVIDSLSYEAPLVDAIPLDEANVESDFTPPPPPQDNPPVVDGEFRTITSGLLIENGPNGPFYFANQTSDKKQITLHFTAGGPNPANNVAWWNTFHNQNGFHISTHYLIGGDGFVEQVFPLQNYANHTGVGGRRKNKYNIGIEICNYGFGYPEKWLASQGRAILVDRNGNEMESWRGIKNYQPLSSGQIQGIRNTLLQIKSAYPKIPLTFNYDACFPGNNVSSAAIEGVPGLYTHNSFKPKGQKWDVHPQKELVEMLKSLA